MQGKKKEKKRPRQGRRIADMTANELLAIARSSVDADCSDTRRRSQAKHRLKPRRKS